METEDHIGQIIRGNDKIWLYEQSIEEKSRLIEELNRIKDANVREINGLNSKLEETKLSLEDKNKEYEEQVKEVERVKEEMNNLADEKTQVIDHLKTKVSALENEAEQMKETINKIKHSEIDKEIQTEIGMDYFD